jgi:hypothetical protein
MEVAVLEFVRNEGSVVLFRGLVSENEIVFAVDHRPAWDIMAALLDEEHEDDVVALVESWQVVG